MSKTAEQAIHDKLWQIVSPLVGGAVYESRPMTDVGYPFADFEDFLSTFTGTKNGTLAQVGYPASMRVSDSAIRVIQDRTVTPPIWRCMVHLEFDI